MYQHSEKASCASTQTVADYDHIVSRMECQCIQQGLLQQFQLCLRRAQNATVGATMLLVWHTSAISFI